MLLKIVDISYTNLAKIGIVITKRGFGWRLLLTSVAVSAFIKSTFGLWYKNCFDKKIEKQKIKGELNMKEIIQEKLKLIEQEHTVKILFAIESGSRAWGFPSKDSDFDVRFVYIKKSDFYLSIDEKRDVIEVPINEILDINGWDIRKALKLFRKSNPPLLEWLVSDIVYYENYGFKEEMLRIRESVFSPKASMHHYLSMARGNFREYLQTDEVRIKKYFYVLRPILACLWIEKYDTNPPILFQTLFEEFIKEESELKYEIDNLLERKMAGDELDLEKRIDSINYFVDTEIARLTDYANTFPVNTKEPTEMLDELFRKYLNKVW